MPKVFRTQKDALNHIMETAQAKLREDEDSHIDQILGYYQQAEKEIKAELNAVFEEMFDSEPGWRLDYMEQTGRTRALLTAIDAKIMELKRKVNAQIEEGFSSQFKSSEEWSAYAIDQATPQDQDTSMPYFPDQQISSMANEPFEGAMFSQRIGVISDAMASDIRDELMQSMIQGESVRDAALRVRQVIGAEDPANPYGYASRATTIAQTEIMRAGSLGRDLLFEQNSDLMDGSPVWLATGDGKVCPHCLRRDGKTDTEIKKEAAGEDPFGRSTRQPLHPRCRCVKVPQLKSWRDLTGLDMPEEFGDTERGMRDAAGKWTIAPIQEFDAWKAERLAA